MRIRIEISEATNGKFSNINLAFDDQNGNEQKVPLILHDFVDIYDLTNDIKSVNFDLFLISALVYGVDSLINRELYAIDGWSRELDVTFPVYNLAQWKGQELIFQDALKFLTGDHWNINFELNSIGNCFTETKGRWAKKRRLFDLEKINATSLFSGGLDSLIGVIDQLENLDTDEEILLVSHFDFNTPGPNRDQQFLFRKLVANYPNKIKNNWIQS